MKTAIPCSALCGLAAALLACAPVAPAQDTPFSLGNDPFDAAGSEDDNPDFRLPSIADLGAGDAASSPTVPSGQLGCRGYAHCVDDCNNSSSSQSGFDQCMNGCDARTGAAVRQQFEDVYNCGFDACVYAGRCHDRNDGSQGCVNCAYDAVAAVYPFSCSGDPICNTSSCSGKVAACSASVP